MKTIYFVRHAKSSWSDFQLADHDRPLNKRGKKDAPRMANRLVESGASPDGILTSTAKRARRTARAFQEAFDVPDDRIIKKKSLYHAVPRGIEEKITALPDEWDTVLVFGHNPGYTDLANQLDHDGTIDNVPTCGIVGARIAIKSWADFSLSKAKRFTFMYPKQEQ
ncbi:SixA phosphatase family protein [Neolewinella antarctica]|uniref:Phosphohistidine phosphatase n=1 Tax=Neolewinella antarctica TaxID=442734 RepID=A0ABX0X831_9BACT|nr:histidine phosphatase family protein [Neolewinella antarctica]NJC25377.1 phosphohistidine phosphatase [Neolewinella antarctica]